MKNIFKNWHFSFPKFQMAPEKERDLSVSNWSWREWASLERLPEVIQRASQEDRRMFVQQLIQGVYAKRDRLIAIRPMPLFNDVFGIAADNQDWLTGAQQYNPSGHLHLITRIGKIKNPIILSLN